MCLRRIDVLQLHKHGPLVVTPAPVIKQWCIFDSSVSIAISDIELVRVLAERAMRRDCILTIKLYTICEFW